MRHKVQRYAYKVISQVLERNNWNIKININKGFKEGTIVGINDSTGLRAIRKLKESPYTDEYILDIKNRIKSVLKDNNYKDNKKLYKDLKKEEKQASLEDTVCNVVFATKKQYEYARKNGFKINGKKYVLLIGTSGGIKKNTVMFIRADLRDSMWELLLGGADESYPMIASKKMSYMSLLFSDSIEVTDTNRILVVKDVKTSFKSPVTYIKFNDELDRPEVKRIDDYQVELEPSDGCGLIHPDLAKKWAEDLDLDYVPAAFCTRKMMEKGILSSIIDFRYYCKNVLKTQYVEDVWGKKHNIDEVDIILNESMLKMAYAYKDLDSYNKFCNDNNISFSVTKVSPKRLENVRTMNYQYLQCLKLSDEDIEGLLADNIQEIKEITGMDYRKAILFGKGIELNEKNVWKDNILEDYYLKVLMIEPECIKDDYIRDKIKAAINNRINLLKTGKIKVHANYQIVIGDPIAQLESMCGKPVKGLLKAGEFYSEYWRRQQVKIVAGFRSPMSCPENCDTMEICNREEVIEWFKGSYGVIIFNAWDTSMARFNGLDFDGDTLFTTDNKYVIKGIRKLLAIFCEGKSTPKKANLKLRDFEKAIVGGFGNAVGGVTNFGSSCYPLLDNFEEGTPEYNEVMYRIQCTQYYQQECIDAAKNGVPPKPIPKYWHDVRAKEIQYNIDEETGEILDTEEEMKQKDFYRRCVADKKPYYFIYIYNTLKEEYNKYCKETKVSCMDLFGVKDINNIINKENKTEEEEIFVKNYNNRSPINKQYSIVNKIADIVENEFSDRFTDRNQDFNWDIYKTDDYTIGTNSEITAIKKVYKEFTQKGKDLKTNTYEQLGKEERTSLEIQNMENLINDLNNIIPNHNILLNTLLYLTYDKKTIGKTMLWKVVGKEIIRRLLKKHDNKIYFPKQDKNGDFSYNRIQFSMQELKIKGDN